MNLINDLMSFVQKRYGNIEHLETMTNPIDNESVFIKYKKVYTEGGEMKEDFKIGKIDRAGNVMFIDDRFKNMFERYAFLSECISFDVKDESAYLIID
jgi:hypothetical protein